MKDNSITTHHTQETRIQLSHSKFTDTVSIRIDPELWSRFKTEVQIRGASTCHVLAALMEAWIEGQKATATVIKPVVINQTFQYIVERPRRNGMPEPCVPNPYLCEQKCAKAFMKQFKGGET